MVAYSGSTVHYAGMLLVDPAFRKNSHASKPSSRVGTAVYGVSAQHPPLWAYSCQLPGARAHCVSEHALGNAIDIVGSTSAPRTGRNPPGRPASVGAPFLTRVARH